MTNSGYINCQINVIKLILRHDNELKLKFKVLAEECENLPMGIDKQNKLAELSRLAGERDGLYFILRKLYSSSEAQAEIYLQ